MRIQIMSSMQATKAAFCVAECTSIYEDVA